MSQRVKRTVSFVDENPKKSRTTKTAKMSKKSRSSFKSVSSKQGTALMLPYHEWSYGTLAIAFGVNDHVYRGNGMYDPHKTGGGHQPFGYDQAMALYKKYYVVNSEIVATVDNPTPATAPIAYLACCVWADTVEAAPADAQVAVERCFANGGKVGYMGNTYRQQPQVRHKMYTKQVLRSGMEEDNNHGTIGADPVAQWYWHVCMIKDNVLVERGYDLVVDIKYNAVFTEPNLNLGS